MAKSVAANLTAMPYSACRGVPNSRCSSSRFGTVGCSLGGTLYKTILSAGRAADLGMRGSQPHPGGGCVQAVPWRMARRRSGNSGGALRDGHIPPCRPQWTLRNRS